MPQKTTKAKKRYSIDGKTFTWTTDEGETVTIPLRLKLKVIRAISQKNLDDVSTMFEMIDAIAPGQAEVLDEQDVNDFTEMFSAWQSEYNALNGASLGE